MSLHSLYSLFSLSLSILFFLAPSLPEHTELCVPSPPTFAKSVFAHNIIGYGIQAGEGSQPTQRSGYGLYPLSPGDPGQR